MHVWGTKALEILGKTSPVIFFGLTLATAIILFTNETLLAEIYLSDLKSEYKTSIGVVFIVSFSMLVAQIGQKLWSAIGASWRKRRNLKLYQKTLHDLTPEEKEYLAHYIKDEETTQYSPLDDGVAQGLEAKTIVYRASSLSMSGLTFPFNLQPWAKDYLTANPHLLD